MNAYDQLREVRPARSAPNASVAVAITMQNRRVLCFVYEPTRVESQSPAAGSGNRFVQDWILGRFSSLPGYKNTHH